MKKRKPPIVLATCLVIMLVAVGIIYSPGRAADDGHGHDQPPPPPSAEQAERPKMSPSQVSSMASGAMTPTSKPGMPKPMGGDPSKPSIAVPKQQTYKPTPNDSSTSTQWYTDQTKK